MSLCKASETLDVSWRADWSELMDEMSTLRALLHTAKADGSR